MPLLVSELEKKQSVFQVLIGPRQVGKTTIAHYLRMLETAFLVSGLELFSRGSARKRGSSPKLLLWNNALVNALSNRSFDESIADASWWGRLVENAVGGYLLNMLSSADYTITYWRYKDREVD